MTPSLLISLLAAINAEGSRLCHMEEEQNALYRMRCDAMYYNVSWELCACSVHMSVCV